MGLRIPPSATLLAGDRRSDKRIDRDRIRGHHVRRTKDIMPDSLDVHLLPVLMARPDPPPFPGNGASSDVGLRHVCGRKRAGVTNVDKRCSAGSQAARSRSLTFETPEV